MVLKSFIECLPFLLLPSPQDFFPPALVHIGRRHVANPFVGAVPVAELGDMHYNAIHEFENWPIAPAAPVPTGVDTGTEVVDKSNLVTFRQALAAHQKPL